MEPDGSDKRLLSSDIRRHARAPAWSPDGRRIAFFLDAGTGSYDDFDEINGAFRRWALWTMNDDGSDKRRLRFLVANDPQVEWSPDGSELAYHRRIGKTVQIVVTSADGALERVVTRGSSTYASEPTWSPDGRRMAFVADYRRRIYAPEDWGWTRSLYVVNADGTGLRRLTREEADSPNFSPDGSRILFFAAGRGVLRRGGGIFEIPAEGGRARRLVAPEDFSNDLEPVWSPDGRKLLFYSTRWGQDEEIGLANADGSCPTPLPLSGSSPSWQPDPGRAPSAEIRCADAVLRLRRSTAWPVVGRPLVLTALVTNSGNEPAPNVTLKYTVNGAVVESMRPTRGSCRGRRPIRCAFGALGAGARASVAVRVRPTGKTLGHRGTVRAPGDRDPSTNFEGWGYAVCTHGGTPGPDILNGSSGPDRICGFAGDDVIDAGGGDDEVFGGGGADTIDGAGGDDLIIGGAQNDVLRGGNGDDTIWGGGGRDDVAGGFGDDTTHTEDGRHDRVTGGPGADESYVDRWDVLDVSVEGIVVSFDEPFPPLPWLTGRGRVTRVAEEPPVAPAVAPLGRFSHESRGNHLSRLNPEKGRR